MRLTKRPRRLIALVAGLLITILAIPGIGGYPRAGAQDATAVLELPAIAVADELTGFVRTYGLDGSLTSSTDLGYDPGDKIAYGYFGGGRPENRGCIVIARASGPIDFCVNEPLFSRLLDAEFTADDDLAMGNVLGPDIGSDEVIVGRASSGLIDVYAFDSSEFPLPVNKVATIDAGYSAGESIHVTHDLFGFGSGDEIVIANGFTGQARIYERSDASGEFGFVGGFDLPFGFDQIGIGNMDGSGNPEIAIAGVSNGAVAVFDYSRARIPSIQQIDSFATSFSAGDSLVIADVHGNLTDDILIADAESGLVDVYSHTLDVNDPLAKVPSLNFSITPGTDLARLPLTFPDSDVDGLLDLWETTGLDADGDGNVDVDLPGFGADPLHKDMYVEYDWMRGHEPSQQAVNMVVDAFALAPVNAGGVFNPDGQLGITLHFDTGNLGGGNELVNEAGGPWTDDICNLDLDRDGNGLSDFYEAKSITANFDPRRSFVFRYAISAESCPGISPGGQGEIGGNDLIEFVNPAPFGSEDRFIFEASNLMHEIGHTLGLKHGGFEPRNCKPNYVSIMSYSLDVIERVDGTRFIDFSPPLIDDSGNRGSAPLGTLDENRLIESEVLDATDPVNRFTFLNGQGIQVLSPLNEPVDWDGDGTIDSDPVAVNVDNINTSPFANPDESCPNEDFSILSGHNDWLAISVPFRHFVQSANAPVNPVRGPEPTLEEMIERQETLHTTDLAIAVTGAPDSVVAGTEMTYSITVTNNGPNPANAVQVVNTLPEGLSYLSGDAECVVDNGVVTCDFGVLPAGATHDFSLAVLVASDVVFNAGGPATISNSFTVNDQDEFAEDPDSTNNTAEVETTVTAEADIEVVSFDLPDDPVLVMIGEPVAIQAEKLIANHGPSGPVHVSLEIDAPAGAGFEVELASPTEATAPGSGAAETIVETLSLTCIEPGLHTIPVTNSVSPVSAAEIDPDLDDNQATDQLIVQCAVPVAINIKPGSQENPVNFRGRGVNPLAVLSTEAGEYGLPVAFDATRINPDSVRFGAASVLLDPANPSGASEAHNRGHIEDSLEMDEQTKDGDQDMVLHFRLAGSGLEPGDTEACVFGEARSASGETFVFSGCDAINTRP